MNYTVWLLRVIMALTMEKIQGNKINSIFIQIIINPLIVGTLANNYVLVLLCQ
jgi:hypothetical protein